MIEALQADEELFQRSRKRLNEVVTAPLHQRLGFTPEMFDAEFKRIYRKVTEE